MAMTMIIREWVAASNNVLVAASISNNNADDGNGNTDDRHNSESDGYNGVGMRVAALTKGAVSAMGKK